MNTFGGRLKDLREKRGWSQEKLGFEMEVTKATISKWENDRSEPGLKQLARLRTLFDEADMSLDFLVIGGATHIGEESAVYRVAGRAAESKEEETLLVRFRQLPQPKRRALVELISD